MFRAVYFFVVCILCVRRDENATVHKKNCVRETRTTSYVLKERVHTCVDLWISMLRVFYCTSGKSSAHTVVLSESFSMETFLLFKPENAETLDYYKALGQQPI